MDNGNAYYTVEIDIKNVKKLTYEDSLRKVCSKGNFRMNE